jgi:hypothetical protein
MSSGVRSGSCIVASVEPRKNFRGASAGLVDMSVSSWRRRWRGDSIVMGGGDDMLREVGGLEWVEF